MRHLCCVLLIMITLAGCDRGPTYVPVTGTVKYSDGTVPTGDIASITFQPASAAPDTKGASGTIQPDGTFSLTTINPGDGARPGDYVVKVNVMKGYPGGTSLVADTPLKATVTEDGENHFDFVVERP
ncbi:MAG TPA: hypothetical protein VGK58_14395 [Lacipirellulaceae bacterium]